MIIVDVSANTLTTWHENLMEVEKKLESRLTAIIFYRITTKHRLMSGMYF